ncbi:hypothetical protein KY284_028386 [Solanum tuberosum]|nr:hypothetical protein KY284_028386 [Solanum tuberosum]
MHTVLIWLKPIRPAKDAKHIRISSWRIMSQYYFKTAKISINNLNRRLLVLNTACIYSSANSHETSKFSIETEPITVLGYGHVSAISPWPNPFWKRIGIFLLIWFSILLEKGFELKNKLYKQDGLRELFNCSSVISIVLKDKRHIITTIERFSSSVTSKTNLKGLLEILASASEFEQLPIRPGEEESIKRLINHLPLSFENPKYTDPHVKANALLQAHLSRRMVVGNLAFDQREVLLSATRLLQAMVDVVSSNGWLSLALLTMEVSQMATQGLWHRNSIDASPASTLDRGIG